ncbi:(2Fe-2S)-binding protein [Fusobacteria bacterium ZRK30]|nr:(2Fe-2S)-binding protein [Fusobacteria bacterium ZRK30]
MYEYICYCDKVTKGDIVTAVFGGAKTFKEVIQITGAMKNSNCEENNPKGVCCSADIIELLKEYS